MVNNLSGYINFKGNVNSGNTVSSKKSAVNTNSEVTDNTEQKQTCSPDVARAYCTTGVSTTLNNDVVKQKYAEVSSILEPETKVLLSGLLKSGILLNNNSNDGSSVLDNLYKMATEPKIRGLNHKTLTKEAIETIATPGKITQTFGDIPDSVVRAVFRHPELGVRTVEEMDINEYSNCCVAASIEYNMAAKKPAEFMRMAADLTSENYSTVKNLKLSDIAENKEDALWLLDTFKLPYKTDNDGNVQVIIAPDRNAIIRARVQTSYKDEGERTPIDVLMQSALMNVGSQQTYNSLNDTRIGLFSSSNAGLTELEKTFTEEVFEGNPKTPVIYQAIGDDGKVEARACDYQTMAKQLINAVDMGQNVIMGYVSFNETGQVIGGHEITLTGYGESPTGDLVFICNDTQDNQEEPIYVLAENLLPRLHHAGLPQEALEGLDMPTSFDGINYYKQALS